MTLEYATPPFLDYFIGLDLGKSSDYTAAAVVERGGPPGNHHYDVVGLERMKDQMYPDVITCVQNLVADPALRPRRHYPADARGPERLEWAPPSTLVIDSTGVGEPVTDMLLTSPVAALMVPVKVTGGDSFRRGRWPGKSSVPAYWVAKGLLCSTAQSLLQGGRLRISPRLKLAETLRDELRGFNVKVTAAGNETYGEWRTGKHDDLVFATAIACWFADLTPVVNTLTVAPNPLANRRWGLAGYRG